VLVVGVGWMGRGGSVAGNDDSGFDESLAGRNSTGSSRSSFAWPSVVGYAGVR
jgi:hypothetical protein